MSQINQYQTPQSRVDRASAQEYAEVKIFGTRGRIGRLRYLGYSVAVYLLYAIITAVFQAIFMVNGLTSAAYLISTAITLILLIVQIVLMFRFAIQRSHDMNSSGWLSLILLIPLIGFLIFVFAPGTDGENNYGPPPPPNSAGVYILAFLAPLIIIGVLAAIAIPAYQGYVQKAQENQQQQQFEQQR